MMGHGVERDKGHGTISYESLWNRMNQIRKKEDSSRFSISTVRADGETSSESLADDLRKTVSQMSTVPQMSQLERVPNAATIAPANGQTNADGLLSDRPHGFRSADEVDEGGGEWAVTSPCKSDVWQSDSPASTSSTERIKVCSLPVQLILGDLGLLHFNNKNFWCLNFTKGDQIEGN